MTCSRFILILITIIFVLGLLPWAGRAVEIYAEDKAFWDAFKKAREVDDLNEIKKLVKRSKKNAEGVVESLTTALCQKGTQDDWDDLKILADTLEATANDSRYVHRLELLKRLTPEQRNERLIANNNYYYGNVKFQEGKTQDNIYTMAEAKEFFRKAIEGLDKIGDLELMIVICLRQGQCLQTMGEHYEACVIMKKALDTKEQLPFAIPDMKWCEHEFKKYTDKGYDPTKPKDEGGEPPGGMGDPGGESGGDVGGDTGAGAGTDPTAVATGTEFAFKTVGEKETWPLKYSAMKKPDEFVTPSFYANDNPFLWDQMHIQGPDKMQFKPVLGGKFDVYGKQLNCQRDNFKVTFDIDGEKSTTKVLTMKEKPQPLVLNTVENDANGKPLKYQLFVCCPGSQEVMFSLNTNMAPSEGWMVVRSRIGCTMKGKVLGGNFVLIDDNSSGIYGDPLPYPADGITDGEWAYWTTDAVVAGKSKKAVPLSRIMPIDDKFYLLEPDRFGRNVSTTEVETPTGTVRVDWKGGTRPTYVILHGLDREGTDNFFDVADALKKGVPIPVGKYEFCYGKIVSGKKNKLQQIRIYRGNSKPFFVKEGEEALLELGGPFKFKFRAGPFGGKYVVTGKSINIFGRSGEIYGVFFDDVVVPTVSIRPKGGKRLVVKDEEMKKPTVDDWYNDQYCVWHPLDFEYENKKSEDLETRLELKKHKVLGGPIESDWE